MGTDDLTGLESVRFAGVALGGGKSDRTSFSAIDWYPGQKRLFLRVLKERVRGEPGGASADQELARLLQSPEAPFERVGVDAPLQLPKCLRCDLPCPGVEDCVVPAVVWMREEHAKRARLKRPLKMFTPYTERPTEMFVATELDEPFHPPHALGANAAPLAARAAFLMRRTGAPAIEVYPKAAIWRIGRSLKIQKSYLRYHRHSIEGDEARLAILNAVVDRGIAFVYQQDLKTMVESSQAFDAFICALVAFLAWRGQTEPRPSGFPEGEAWIETPKADLEWN